jgi:hypothetical protein
MGWLTVIAKKDDRRMVSWLHTGDYVPKAEISQVLKYYRNEGSTISIKKLCIASIYPALQAKND